MATISELKRQLISTHIEGNKLNRAVEDAAKGLGQTEGLNDAIASLRAMREDREKSFGRLMERADRIGSIFNES